MLWDTVAKEEEVKIIVPEPYPTIDWSKVNKRFISNIPEPTLVPIHSCSSDPEFYAWKERKHPGNRIEKIPSRFDRYQYYQSTNPKCIAAQTTSPHVFGALWGYETSEGIVSVSSLVHHGYTWKGQWILHAEKPSASVKENNFGTMKKVKRKKE